MIEKISNQLRLLDHCDRAYGCKPESELHNVMRIVEGNDQCIIGWDSKLSAVILAFRGSDKEKWDWISNLKCIGIKTIFGRFHNGFYNSTMKMIPRIEETLSQKEFRFRRVLVTGHSRGGAQANIASLHLDYYELANVVGLVTFGSPRVAKKAGARAIELLVKNIVRIVNNGDRVARLPYAFLGYRHAEKMTLLKGRFLRRFPLIGFKDHGTSYYRKKMKALEK